MNDKDEVKKIIEAEEVPEKLQPENIKKMLDEKAPKKKRSNISMVGRITAMASACALIVGMSVQTMNYMKKDKATIGHYDSEGSGSDDGKVDYQVGTDAEGHQYATYTGDSNIETVELENVKAPYMAGAKDYEQVYKLLKKVDKKYKNNNHKYVSDYTIGGFAQNDAMQAETAIESAAEDFSPNDYGYDEESDYRFSETVKGDYASEEPTTEFIPPITEPVTATPEITTEPSTEALTEPVTTEEVTENTTATETFTTTSENTESTTETTTTTAAETDEDEAEDYSETYNQEKGVLEADIVKTNGKNIYYLNNRRYELSPVLNIASVKKGKFTDSRQVSVAPETYLEEGWESNIQVNDMYLYNDMIAVIGTLYAYKNIYETENKYYDDEYSTWYTPYHYEEKNECFVSFYTKDAELIGTYWQDGDYSDVRISPDGYMYLVSTYQSCIFDEIENAEDIEKYIPQCGVDDNFDCMPPCDILLPEKKLDNGRNLSYTIIGSIDLTVSAQFTPIDSKALADYTGKLYSSAENIYVTVGWEDTNITRISVSGGNIVPMASGKVDGYVKDQFSMSEYNGYFRIATTVNKWVNHGNFVTDALGIYKESEHIQDNRVYVLDMDLNPVGFVGGFGENETIKSVNFSGNMGYVVTYRQTDPLFAIDLSNPAEPFITDEFKILGYSTYMQNWTDGLLLGFGVDADEKGIENGIKLVMFDNSDPYNLKEVGLYSIKNDDFYLYSSAVWDRKQLLIEPEKNLIGVPVTRYSEDHEISEYVFFSYENGEFIRKGTISKDIIFSNDDVCFDRAAYIGDYVYVLSANKFVSADIETITISDEITF